MSIGPHNNQFVASRLKVKINPGAAAYCFFEKRSNLSYFSRAIGRKDATFQYFFQFFFLLNTLIFIIINIYTSYLINKIKKSHF